jgi:hypothetical protein
LHPIVEPGCEGISAARVCRDTESSSVDSALVDDGLLFVEQNFAGDDVGRVVVDDMSLPDVVRQPRPLTPKQVSEIAGLLASAFRPAR